MKIQNGLMNGGPEALGIKSHVTANPESKDAGKVNASNGLDQIELASQMQLMNQTLSTGTSEAKLQRLADLVQSGQYNPDPSAIADSIIKEAKGE